MKMSKTPCFTPKQFYVIGCHWELSCQQHERCFIKTLFGFMCFYLEALKIDIGSWIADYAKKDSENFLSLSLSLEHPKASPTMSSACVSTFESMWLMLCLTMLSISHDQLKQDVDPKRLDIVMSLLPTTNGIIDDDVYRKITAFSHLASIKSFRNDTGDDSVQNPPKYLTNTPAWRSIVETVEHHLAKNTLEGSHLMRILQYSAGKSAKKVRDNILDYYAYGIPAEFARTWVNRLKTIKSEAVRDEKCPICWLQYSETESDVGHRVKITPCGHMFGANCLADTLALHPRGITKGLFCPVCMQDMEMLGFVNERAAKRLAEENVG